MQNDAGRFGSHTPDEPSLPDGLRRIRSEAEAFRSQLPDIASTERLWRDQVDRIRRAIPRAHVDDDGVTVRWGDLSPGCMACKAGKWDCVFGTMACNLACAFCISPRRTDREPEWSALGRDVTELREEYEKCGVVGASFSGGEPFLEPDRVLAWVAALRREFHDLYLWAYTNGLPLTRPLLGELAYAGLSELRFNLAATGYSDPHVWRMLCEAAELIPSVAVEIPALPDDESTVLTALPRWADAGVTYLNLHELVYEPGSLSEGMSGERAECTMPDGHRCDFDPRSETLVTKVLDRAILDELPIGVNYCSLRNKAGQIRGRRRMMAEYTLQPHEILLDDATAESVCYFDSRQFEFIHPSTLADRRQDDPDRQAARVRRLLPLSRNQPGRWVEFQLLSE